MNKLLQTKQNQLILVVVATLAILGVLWMVLISPLRSTLTRMATQTADARSKVSLGERIIGSGPSVAQDWESASNRLHTAERSMASGDLYAWMIQTMNQFKLSHRVVIPQISREIPCDIGVLPDFPYRAATFILRGNAYYHDFGQFVADLENQFPYMRVQNLELEPLTGANLDAADREQLQFKVELVTLVKPVTP